MIKCLACKRTIFGKPRRLPIGTGPESALFCEDATECQRTIAGQRVMSLVAKGATVESALNFLERSDKGGLSGYPDDTSRA